MAGFTERLQILIDGNASGAIREFQKVGAAADKELGRTEDKLERLSNRLTGIGTGLLAGGAVAVTGLKQLADSASAYSEQVSAATVTFGEEGAAQLEAFAAAAADTANISKTEATKAANSFATFARQAGLTGESAVKFSTDLVQLAGDISSFRDISVADALAALQSGLAGEGEPIRRLGGDISEVALKAEYLALTGEQVTGSLTTQQKVLAINSKLFKDFELAQGDVIRTSDSLANQTRNAQAEFENLKIELGTQLTPIFATIVGGVSNLIGSLQGLPDPIRNTLGALAGIGSFGAVAVGALSLVAGQAIKFRDAFTETTTSIVDGVETQRRSVTKLGNAAIIIGKIGAALAISEGIFNILNSAANITGQIEDGLNRTLIAAQKSGPEVLDAFETLVRGVDLELGIGKVFTDFGTQIELGNGRLKTSVEDVQQAFDKLKGADPAVASATLDELQRVTDGLDRSSGQFKANQEFIDRNRESLRLSAEADAAKTGTLDALAGQLENTNGPAEVLLTTVEGLAVKTDDAKNAFQAYSDTLKANTDPFFAVVDAAGGLADAQQKVAEAYIALFTDGATAQEFVDLADAQRDAVGAAVGLESTIATLRGEVEAGNIEYGSAIETLDILAQKYPALAAPGGPIDQVKKEFFFAALEAQNLSESAPGDLPVSANVQPVLDGLSRLSGGLFAVKAQSDLTADAIGNVTTPTNVQPVLDGLTRLSGGLATVKSAADRAAESVINLFGGVFAGKAPQMSVEEQNAATINSFQEYRDLKDYNGNGIIGRAIGGPVAKGQTYMVGEEGPELFVPRVPGRIISNGQMQMGGPQIIQNITTPDPLQTAAEVVRRQRDAEFLAGV